MFSAALGSWISRFASLRLGNHHGEFHSITAVGSFSCTQPLGRMRWRERFSSFPGKAYALPNQDKAGV